MFTIIGLGLLFLAAGLFLMHRMGKRDDGDMFDARSRWILTGLLGGIVVLAFRQIVGAGPAIGVLVLVVLIPVGVILSFLWVPTLVEHTLSALTSAMTGGKESVEPKPYYFRALARRKKGEYSVALGEIDAELLKFPGDAEGLLLKAEILADDMKDLPSALGLLAEMESTPGRPASGRLLAQFRRADLLILRGGDVAAGRELLRTIIAENPDSEAAHTARQRLAGLPGEGGAAPEKPRKLLVVEHSESLGLTRDLGSESLPKEDPGAEAGRLVALVNEHPDHWESRERLAMLYADHYGRIPLAVDQIAALVAHPGHPPKRVAGWLNRIADLHLRAPDGAEAARQPLREIISRYPDTVWSEQATLRLATLGRSEKAAEPTKTLRIGMYEQNIGLKRGSASIPNPDPRC